MIFHDINKVKPPQGVRFLAKIKDATNGSIDYEVAEIFSGGAIFTSKCGYCHTDDITDDITDEVIAWAYIEES